MAVLGVQGKLPIRFTQPNFFKLDAESTISRQALSVLSDNMFFQFGGFQEADVDEQHASRIPNNNMFFDGYLAGVKIRLASNTLTGSAEFILRKNLADAGLDVLTILSTDAVGDVISSLKFNGSGNERFIEGDKLGLKFQRISGTGGLVFTMSSHFVFE